MQIVLSSDHQLRQNLLELLDHKVIIDRVDERRNKKIYIMKYEKRTLEKLIDLKIDWFITPFVFPISNYSHISIYHKLLPVTG